jgi:hypothetical protein
MMALFNREVLGLIPWFIGSWLLAVAVAVLLWLAQEWSRPARAMLRVLYGESRPLALGDFLAALYAIGIPYAALVTGYLSAEVMGLSGFSWWQTLGRGAVLGAGLLALLWLVWRYYLRAVPPPATMFARSRRLLRTPAGRALFLLWAAAEEFHWAFYRAAPTLLWGPGTGLWAGLLLAVAERAICPQTTARLRQAGGIEEEAWWLAKIVVMTAAFAVLGNLWVCIVLHALLEVWVGWLVQRRETAPAERARAVPRPAPAVPVIAGGTVLLLLIVFTWQAGQQRMPRPVLGAIQGPASSPLPTPFVVPTPTSIPTPLPVPTGTPTPTATPFPTATPEPTMPRTYVVRPGDTLKDIAFAFDVSVQDLMQINGLTDPDTLQVGQVLIIP